MGATMLTTNYAFLATLMRIVRCFFFFFLFFFPFYMTTVEEYATTLAFLSSFLKNSYSFGFASKDKVNYGKTTLLVMYEYFTYWVFPLFQ